MQKDFRIKYLDVSKGLGILLVVFAHVIQIVPAQSGLFSILFRFIYSFHMPLFFVISGILLSKHIYNEHETSSLLELIKKKTSQLLYPYFKWSIIYILIILVERIIRGESPVSIVMERGYAMLTGRGIAPLWFLLALYEAEVIILCIFFNKRRTIQKLAVWIITCALLSCICSRCFQIIDATNLSPFISYWIISVFRIPVAVFFVLLGVFFWPYLSRMNRGPMWIESIIMIITVSIWGVLNYACHNNVNMHLFSFDSIELFLLTGSLGSCFVLLFSKRLESLSSLSKVGKDSLNIMVLHYPPIPIITLLCVATHHMYEPVRIIMITILTIVIIELINNLIASCLKQKKHR